MKKAISTLIAVSAMVVGTVSPVFASNLKFDEKFNNHFSETWHPVVYETGTFTPESYCGTTVCGTLEHQGGDKFLRLHLKTNAVTTAYSDLEMRQSPYTDPISTGPWTATFGHPVTFETNVRTGAGHNADGSGGAIGSLGIGLWNNGAGIDAPSGMLDSMSFQWVEQDFADAFGMDGFTAVSATHSFPQFVLRPTHTINLQGWNVLKFVWSVDASGVQSVEYFINDCSIGIRTLSTPMHGLNVYAWQDNQIYNNAFQLTWKVPTFEQTFDVDYIKVTQK